MKQLFDRWKAFLAACIRRKRAKNLSAEQAESSTTPRRGWYFLGGLFSLFATGGAYFFLSHQATIFIRPEVTALPVWQNFILTLPDYDIPASEEFLPQLEAIWLETSLTDSQVFPTSGERYQVTNASGKLVLFNETTEPKFLLPSRLKSSDGVVVRTLEEVIIPPKQGATPGQLEVVVQADEFDEEGDPIGKRGNILAGTRLDFPALTPASQQKYYARTIRGPLVGGSTLVEYFFSEEDVEGIPQQFVDILTLRGNEKLRTEVLQRNERDPNEKYFLVDHPQLLLRTVDSAIIQDPPAVGTLTDTVTVQAEVTVRGLLFRLSDLEEFLVQKVKTAQDHRHELVTLDSNSFQFEVLEYEPFFEEKWLKIFVSMEGVEVVSFESDHPASQQWIDHLLNQIKAQEADKVRAILTNQEGIAEVVNIQISPFWRSKLPNKLSAIQLETLAIEDH